MACASTNSWFSFNMSTNSTRGDDVVSGNNFAGSPYLRNSSVNGAPNGYVFNITVAYNNISIVGGVIGNTSIIQINLTLPAGLSFVNNSNVSSVAGISFTRSAQV